MKVTAARGTARAAVVEKAQRVRVLRGVAAHEELAWRTEPGRVAQLFSRSLLKFYREKAGRLVIFYAASTEVLAKNRREISRA